MTNTSQFIKPLLKNHQHQKRRNEYALKSIEQCLEQARILLSMMKPARFSSYREWMHIGGALHEIRRGAAPGYELFEEFCRKHDGRSTAQCLKKWPEYYKFTRLGMDTLKGYARIDNGREYALYQKEISESAVKTALLHNNPTDLARVLFTNYGDEFKRSSATNQWWRFDNGVWTREEEIPYALRECMCDENGPIMQQIVEYRVTATQETRDRLDALRQDADMDIGSSNGQNRRRDESEAEDDSSDGGGPRKRRKNDRGGRQDKVDRGMRLELRKKLEIADKLAAKCKITKFKSDILEEACEQFRVEDFEALLDKNAKLRAFKNGVYDFQSECFRDGRPEDYISISLPVEYVNFCSESHPQVVELLTFFEQVFHDPIIHRDTIPSASDSGYDAVRRRAVLLQALPQA